MSEAQLPPQKPSAWVRFWRFLIRFIFVLVIGILLGAVIYWAVPTIYRQFIQPVQIHGMRLDTLETRLDLYESGADDRMAGLQTRLESLETLQDNDKESLALLEGQVNELESLSATQQAQLADLESQSEQIAKLESDLASLDDKLGEIQNAVSFVQIQQKDNQKEIKQLETQLVAQNTALKELSDVVYAEDDRWETIQRELQTIQAMELLSRARINLTQANLVLAENDIQAARDLLAALQVDAPEEQFELLGTTLGYLDAALEALPDSPVSAADNLENAWQLILQGLLTQFSPEAEPAAPQPVEEVTPTPTPSPTPTLSPTPSPTPTS